MADIKDIGNPLEASPDWFSALFAHIGIDAEVRSLTAKSIGTGQIGENVRFVFDYARAAPDAPASLVGKFPSDNPSSLATAQLLGHYRREVKFYNTFGDVASKIAPAALYADHDEATNRFHLIMQDMAPSVQGDQLAGCDIEHARRAVKLAAILHAAHWNDPSLDSHEWLQGTEAAPAEPITPVMVAGLWEGFKERYADRIEDDSRRVGDVYAAYLATDPDQNDGPFALTHGDYRLDNMLFGAGDAPKPLAIVDWQTPGKRGPMMDIAYFIGAAFKRADRKTHEQDLLRLYYSELQSHGITDYSFDDLYRHYRLFSFYGMSVAFGAAMLVQQTERGDELFLTMMRRHVAQALENDALSVLAT